AKGRAWKGRGRGAVRRAGGGGLGRGGGGGGTGAPVWSRERIRTSAIMRTPWMSTVIDPTSAITYTVIKRKGERQGDFKASFRSDTMTTRREFVGTAAALLLPFQSAPKLPLGFSTLGCPTWPWPRILDFAAEHRFAAVALRVILTNMDLSTVPT